MNIENEIRKLKFHLRLLSDQLDVDSYTYASLAIARDWDESQIDRAQDIFDKYDQELETNGSLNGSKFEHELRERLDIGYQEVKDVVLTFWSSGQWQSLCYEYAKQFKCVEFHKILREED